jgi:hypothetical protein
MVIVGFGLAAAEAALVTPNVAMAMLDATTAIIDERNLGRIGLCQYFLVISELITFPLLSY